MLCISSVPKSLIPVACLLIRSSPQLRSNSDWHCAVIYISVQLWQT
jgi:hypothetical protein